MKSYCIHGTVLGTEEHFCSSDAGFSWSSSLSKGSWVLGGGHTHKSLSALLDLAGVQLPSLPTAHVSALRHLVTGSHVPVPWQHVLPRRVYENYFKNTVKVIEDVYSELPFAYYDTAWSAGSEVLGALKAAKIDVEAWQRAIESPGVNAPALSSFKPDPRGFADVPTYNRFGTRTGRLTVTEGPNILVLKRELRSIIQTSFKSGAVCSLDFRALEPRIVLAEAGRSSDAEDMYGEVADKIFGDRSNRDAVKVAIISELYGAAKESLRSRLGISQAKIDAFVRGINDYFQLSVLRARLESQAQSGKIVNKFGRPLAVDPEAKNTLVNTYVQSTGVDVAMLGFNQILKQLGTDGIRPLFVLHDALILDVRADRTQDVAQVASVRVQGYEADFPLKLEKL